MLNVLFSLSLQFINGIFHTVFPVLQEASECWGWVTLSCLGRGEVISRNLWRVREKSPFPGLPALGTWGAEDSQGASPVPWLSAGLASIPATNCGITLWDGTASL